MTNPAHPLARRLLPLDPVLAELPPALLHSVLHQHTQRLALPGGQRLFSEGQPCQGFLVLLSGEVRVVRGDPQGCALALYRVGPGELCVASTSCLFGEALLVAHGHTVAPAELALLPACTSALSTRAGCAPGASGSTSWTLPRCVRWPPGLGDRSHRHRCGRRAQCGRSATGRSNLEKPMQTDVGGIDRLRRIGAGALLVALAATGSVGAWGWIGMLPLRTGAFGVCPADPLLGLNTCPLKRD